MRESSFAFPAQNRACVCITSQLYDRRALDTNAPLPLFNSLTHLTYLTSTSPRIREIMTTDGGLERLVRMLHDFCLSPPPPDNPALLYGLSPPNAHSSNSIPVLNPKSFDKHAAYRFSLAFQCVVNIGVRGSEPIRSRVVQAGTLEVVGCILEAWLVNKGFAVGPSTSASGQPRETREQRLARRQALTEARQREQAAQLARALQRQVAADRLRVDRTTSTVDLSREEMFSMEPEPTPTDSRPDSRGTDTSNESSSNATPGTSTPTGAVIVPSRDRSGTIIARPVWDQAPPPAAGSHHRRTHRNGTRPEVPPSPAGTSTQNSADTSRAETETEDDGDVEMDQDSIRESDADAVSGSSSPEQRARDTSTIRAAAAHPRRAVGIVSDTAAATAAGASLDMNTDAHIIIGDQAVAVEGVSVEDGLVSLETNDDFAMGAPPGAPGAIDGPPPHAIADTLVSAGERTPRAGAANLPVAIPIAVPAVPTTTAIRVTGAPAEGHNPTPGASRMNTIRGGNPVNAANAGTNAGAHMHHHHHHHHHHTRDSDAGLYRDEDVLLGLQLLAYLSKYPHVRQAFYKPRASFHPATAQMQQPVAGPSSSRTTSVSSGGTSTPTPSVKEPNSFMKAFASATGRGKEKEKAAAPGISPAASTSTTGSTGSSNSNNTPRMTNVFALVERFTFRPSVSEIESSSPPPTLPPEIQYWAGVIMRNACRKDDSRGGIRQCANMMCGKWETFPREFAKCRRCRKAKYCGKECQSSAWNEGHRFWCSAKDPDDDAEHHHMNLAAATFARGTVGALNDTIRPGATANVAVVAGGTVTGRTERRAERERQTRAVAELQQQRQQREQQGRQLVRAVMRPASSPVAVPNANANAPATTPAEPGAAAAGVAAAGPSQGASNWAQSLLSMRRPRDRGEEGNDAGSSSRALMERLVGAQRRQDAAAVPMDVELPPEVRRHLLQLLQGGRRPDQTEAAAVVADGGASGAVEARVAEEEDEEMVIG